MGNTGKKQASKYTKAGDDKYNGQITSIKRKKVTIVYKVVIKTRPIK